MCIYPRMHFLVPHMSDDTQFVNRPLLSGVDLRSKSDEECEENVSGIIINSAAILKIQDPR